MANNLEYQQKTKSDTLMDQCSETKAPTNSSDRPDPKSSSKPGSNYPPNYVLLNSRRRLCYRGPRARHTREKLVPSQMKRAAKSLPSLPSLTKPDVVSSLSKAHVHLGKSSSDGNLALSGANTSESWDWTSNSSCEQYWLDESPQNHSTHGKKILTKAEHIVSHSVRKSTDSSSFSSIDSRTTFMTASTPGTFVSARSTFSSASFSSPMSRKLKSQAHFEAILEVRSGPQRSHQSWRKEKLDDEFRQRNIHLERLKEDYGMLLQERNLLLPFGQELNWSGKGQHVTFESNEELPLRIISHLGSSGTANVDKVKCRRIILARKRITCSRRLKISDALHEVQHLQRFQHVHIVQLVGTYLQGREFALLMYPAAECDLAKFLEETAEHHSSQHYYGRIFFLERSLLCISSALEFIHRQKTKHMDIKPSNILVRSIRDCATRQPDELPWRIYLADFGFSCSFEAEGESQTDGCTGKTPRYCAPEVYKNEHWGRSADIFSLGCVFTEILTVCCKMHPEDFATFRAADTSSNAYHMCIDRVKVWIDEHLSTLDTYWWNRSLFLRIQGTIKAMLSEDPQQRPSAKDLTDLFVDGADMDHYCCGRGPEPYVAS